MIIFLTVQNSTAATVQYATYGVRRLGSLGNMEALRTLSRPNVIAYNGESKHGITMIISFHQHHYYYYHHPLSSLSPIIIFLNIIKNYLSTYLLIYLLTYLSRERQLYPVRCRHLHVDSHRV